MCAVRPRSPILLGEIALRAQLSGRDFGASARADAVVLNGTRAALPVPLGLVVHALDARAERAFDTRSVRAPGVMVHIVLEGPVDAWLDDSRIQIGRRPDEPVRIALSAVGAPVPFRRRTAHGDYLRKINIGASWAWLEERGIRQSEVMAGKTVRQESWLATPEEIAMAERLIGMDAPDGAGVGQGIEREMLAFALVGRVLARLTRPADGPSPAERERLARMEVFATRPGAVPSLDDIAACGNMSVSSMQRLFRRVQGVSAVARVRQLRLDRAAGRLRDGASVAEAAHEAGYASTEAFATAFKRAFGCNPSALRG